MFLCDTCGQGIENQLRMVKMRYVYSLQAKKKKISVTTYLCISKQKDPNSFCTLENGNYGSQCHNKAFQKISSREVHFMA